MQGSKKRTVLYNATCRMCGFRTRTAFDVLLAKRFMADHLSKSHGYPFIMAHESRLSDFSDTTAFKAKIKPEGTNIFKINRQRFDKPSWKDTAIMSASAKAAFNHAIEVEKHPAYWKAVRRSPKQVAERIQVLEDYSLKALLGIFV